MSTFDNIWNDNIIIQNNSFPDGQVEQIRIALKSLYDNSTTARTILNQLDDPSVALTINYVAGAFGVPSPGQFELRIDVGAINGTSYIDSLGNAIAYPLTLALAHELVHAIEGEPDFPLISDTTGPHHLDGNTVSITNAIHQEMGYQNRLSYWGAISPSETIPSGSYTGGDEIDTAIVMARIKNEGGYSAYAGQYNVEEMGHSANSRDLLIGRNDSVSGYGDHLLSGSGNDFLYGFAGNDTLEGGADSDKIYGGIGNDSLIGGTGIDYLYGDDSGDTVGSADELHGGSERDYLYGGAGNDELSGDDGDDLLYGESGDDQLYGGSGNDVLYGGLGNDSLYGGSGSDDYRIRLSTDSGAGVQHNLIRDLDSDGKLWISDATGNVYSTLSGVAQYNVANDCWTWGGYSLVLRGNDLVIKLDSATIFVHGNDNVAMNFAAA